MWGAYIPSLGVPSGSRVMNQNRNIVLAQTRIENSELSRKPVSSKAPILGSDLVPSDVDHSRKSAFATGKRNEGILKAGLIADAPRPRRNPSRITESSLVFSDHPHSLPPSTRPPISDGGSLRPPDLLGVGLHDRRTDAPRNFRLTAAPAPQLGPGLVPKAAAPPPDSAFSTQTTPRGQPIFVRKFGIN